MFVRSPDGGNDFGYLPKEVSNIIRRQAGPIRLLESDLQHIEERHGEQIRQSKWLSADQFISSVVTECNAIYQGRAGSLFLVADIRGQPARNVIVKLSPGSDENNQDFYAVKTAMLTRRNFLKSHEDLLLWHGTPCLVPSSSVSRLFEADQHPDRENPFRVRTEAALKNIIVTDVTVKQLERHDKKPLLEQDGPIQSSFENPFNPGAKVVTFPSDDWLPTETTIDAGSETMREIVNDKNRFVNKQITQNMKPERYPWGDFPDVLRNGDLGTLKREPEYLDAKAGDEEAALNLADRLIRPDFVEAVRKMGAPHAHPVLLPVLAEESVGYNRIPLAFAENLSEQLGWDTETHVLQVTRSYRTGSGADHRLVIHPEFDGAINRDAGYILVDDTLTMGGTLASLRGYILSHEGTVLGAAVGVAHEGALHLPIRESMLESIFSKHGQQATQAFAKEQWGHGIECLTQAEAGHIRKAVSLDALRDRFAQARDAGIQRMDEAGIASPPPEQDPNTQSLTDPARPIQNHHPPLPETAMQDNRLMGFMKRDGDSVMETYKSRKYQVEDLGDEGLKVRVLMPNVEPGQLPTTDIPQGERAETIRREIAGTNMKDPMHKSAMDKMLGNALEQQEKLNDLAANLKSPVFEPRTPEKAEVAKEMAPQAQNPEVPTPDQEEKASEVRAMKMGPSVVRPSVEQQIESQDMTKEAPGKMNTVERPNYRPFATHGADKLPEGFSSEVRVAALVVREGARMTPETPMEGDDFKGWQVNRIFKQDHALFKDGGNRVMVETLNFATQEEAIAAAKKMEKEPADLKTLYEARARSGAIDPDRFDFMTSVIAEKQQEQEQSKTLQPDKPLKPEPQEVVAKPSVEKAEEPEKAKEPEKTQQVESAGDIAEDMKKMADRPIQAESPFPQQDSAPSPEARPPFARKQRPEVLMADQRGKPLIYDHGDKITVTRRAIIGLGSAARERREAVTEKSLLEARARFGEPVRFEGSPAFQMQTIAMAVKHGIELEPATPLGKKLYEKALEVDQSKNRLGPSEKAMNRPRERAKSPSKGMEL